MGKSIVAFIILIVSIQPVAAQPTQAEIDKMMKQSQEIMKKYGSDSTINKAMKGAQDQQKQITDAMKKQPANGNTTNSYAADAGDYSNVDNWKFPPKNIALLSSLSRKTLTKTEVSSFLGNIYLQLSNKFPQAIKSSVESIAAKYKSDVNKMGAVAVSGWYTDYREEALLLIIKAASLNPDNGLLLNNCAALLNMSGIEEKAIPLLRYLLQSHPASSMVLNNLGQAYAGLGDTDTAMVYLGRCIKLEPENPEANNTAGQIEAAKGNKEKAATYFEQSIKGAYSKPAELKLRKIKKGVSIVPFVRPRVKIPEYFNQFKYQLPPQCTNVSNALTAEAEYQAFREMITKQGQAYGAKLGPLMQQNAQKALQSGASARILRKDEFIAQPFYEFCGIMHRDIHTEYTEAIKELARVTDKNYTTAFSALKKDYDNKYEALRKGFAARADQCCGEGKQISCCPTDEETCKAYNQLANAYLPQFAALTEDWQRKNLIVYQKYFDELVYWGYLTFHPVGEDTYKINGLYPYILQYLQMLGKVAYTEIIKPCIPNKIHATKESNAINESDCPLEIQIPFLVGKFELDCDKFAFKAGEGVIFGYEKNFRTHQSTVSVGIGLKLELQARAGPVEVGASASVGESFFICFDGNNKISDGGLKFEVKAAAGIESDIPSPVKVKTDTDIGYTLGINSGWNFNEGPFKGMLK